MIKTILISGLILSAICLFISQSRGRTRSKLRGSYGPPITVGDRTATEEGATTESDFKFRIVLSKRRGSATSTTPPVPQSTEFYEEGGNLTTLELRTLLEAIKNESGLQPSSTEIIWSNPITTTKATTEGPSENPDPDEHSSATNRIDRMSATYKFLGSVTVPTQTETTAKIGESSMSTLEAFSQSDSEAVQPNNYLPAGKEYLPPPSLSTTLDVPEASHTVTDLTKTSAPPVPDSINYLKSVVGQPSRIYVPPSRR